MKSVSYNKIRKTAFLVFLCAFLLLLNTQRYYFRLDFSREKLYSLSPYTKELLSGIPETVRITYYVSNRLKTLYPQVRSVSDFLFAYGAQNRKISVLITDPQEAGMENTLLSMGIQGQSIQTTEKNQTSFTSVYSAIVIEYENKTALMPFVLSIQALEYDLNTKIENLVHEIRRKVYLLIGNELDLDVDYSFLSPWLEAAGFSPVKTDAASLRTADSSVPLAIFGSSRLTHQEGTEIENFIIRGGNTFFALSPYQIDINGDWSVKSPEFQTQDSLLSMVRNWGVSVENDLVLDISNYRITMQGVENQNQYEYINYPFWITVLPQYTSGENPITKIFPGLQLFWPVHLNLSAPEGVNATPLVYSSPSAWLMFPAKTPERLFITDPFTEYSSSMNPKTVGQYTFAAAVTGSLPASYGVGKSSRSRLVFLADQYFCTKLIGFTNSAYNMEFLVNALLWISRQEQMLAVRSKGTLSNNLSKITDPEIFAREKKRALLFTSVFIPLFMCFFGVAVYVKRRKK